MTRIQSTILLLVLAGTAGATAQKAPTPSVCTQFEGAIDASLKSMSLIRAESVRNDKDAQDVAQLKIANELTTIEHNLRLMERNGCSAFASPIKTNAYFVEALLCVNASKRGEKDLTVCDAETWKRQK